MTFNKNQLVECSLVTNTKGDGFCKFYDRNITDKVEIKNEYLNKAFAGDLVKVRIVGKNRDVYEGRVEEIVSRRQGSYAGHIEEDKGKFYFKSHDKKIYTDFLIPKENLNNATPGDKVIVSIFDWTDGRRSPVGRVEKVMGRKGDSFAEIASMSEERGFQVGFSKEVEDEANQIHTKGISEEDKAKRKDFRSTTTFTIDPIDAKDFDDVISVKFLEGGDVEVGVHIADVSHYLKPGMNMNIEAENRTTSVYLVDRVVPMLPEVLSNDLCSLVEGVDRLTMSAVFVIDKNSNVKSRWFGETVINSAKRFSYEDAQEVIVKKEGKFEKELTYLNETAKILKERRIKEGAILLESEEVKFKLDEKGVPVEVIRKVRFDAHKLVEEFMLLANLEVASYIHSLGPKNHVGVYRVHDKPDKEKMHALSVFLYNLGYNAPYLDDTIEPKYINQVMLDAEDDPNKGTIQSQIVRSMQKAIYTTKNIGHYGLAFKYYSHFTSPIRRYPDVLIHRLMKRYLGGGTTTKEEEAWHESMCLRSSMREKDASEAERNSIKFKQVEYMSARIGTEVSAIVSGLSAWGIFLEDEYSKCEGMIRFKDLGDEFFKFDEKAYIVIGDRGTVFRMGDVYKCRVEKTDLELKTIDYKILEKLRELGKKKLKV